MSECCVVFECGIMIAAIGCLCPAESISSTERASELAPSWVSLSQGAMDEKGETETGVREATATGAG